MASNREYAYYIRGNKVAIVEKGLGAGICSLTGYSNQTTCEAAGGTWTENATGNVDGEYISPINSISDGLEVEYTYSPTYTFPDVVLGGDAVGLRNKFFLNGWTVVDGYLTLLRSGWVWSTFTKVDLDDYIYIGGSDRWNGLHKIQEIQDNGATTHGGIKTYTKVSDYVPSIYESTAVWTINEQITDLTALAISETFTDAATTPYLWISGSTTNVKNNGMFSGWTIDTDTVDSVLYMSAATRYSFTSNFSTEEEDDANFTGDADTMYIYKAFHDSSSYFITDMSRMEDESFELDLSRYQANAVVNYVKARYAEDIGDLERKEYFMREFRMMVEKYDKGRAWGPRKMMGSGVYNRK